MNLNIESVENKKFKGEVKGGSGCVQKTDTESSSDAKTRTFMRV